MNRTTILILTLFVFGNLFTACGGSTTDSNDINHDSGQYDSNDVVETDTAPDSDTAGDETSPDGEEAETETTYPCPTDLVPLTIDDETECVDATFAQVVTDINGTDFVRVEPDDGNENICQIHLKDYFGADKALRCPDAKYIIHGLQPLGMICIESDLSLSLCKDDANLCDGVQVTEGQISYDESDDKYSIEYTQSGDGWSQLIIYNEM